MSNVSIITSTGTVNVVADESKVIISPVAAAGIGIPAGGTTNQALLKNTNSDYDTVWANVVLEVSGDGVDNTDPKRPTLSFPTPDEIGAYSNTNPDNFVNAQGAADAAPVQSVNGETGNVSVFDGGNTGDILVKNSNTNYDTSWTDSITVDKITYDIAAAETLTAEGQTAWDADARTLAINKGNDFIQYITQELSYQPSRNTEATALIRGELVMVDPAQPAQGQTLRLKRYISNGTYPVDLFVGMVGETIQPNETGFVEWFGQLRNLSLPLLQPVGEVWAEGDILWPNPSIAGGMTKFEPSAPAHKVTVAAILRVNGNNINLQLRPNLRSKVADLHDVQITNASNSQVLSWNGTAWVNATISTNGVQSVTGDGVDNTDPQNPVLSFPTLDDIGAYSNTNPAGYVNSTGAAAAAPVQSVNGQTNVVNLALDDLTDVNATNASNGQTLVYNSTALAWEAVSVSAGGVQSVTGDGVDNTDPANPVLSFPTVDEIGAYSNTNPDNFVNAAGAASAAPVQSVNGQTNVVTLGADDVGAYSNTNPANYINVAQAAAAAPVQSVNGQTNVVVLGADDVGAYSNTNPENYINVAQAAAAAPIQTVTGDGVDNTNVGNVVISYPTIDDIGAYSNTNPANYINVAQASAAAPVQSVNGQTNVVVLGADDVGAYSNTNPANYINVAQAAAAAPVQSVNGQTNVVVLGADDVGAYSNTNPANYINVAQAAAAAPVQSVNGQTNVVVLTADDVGAYSNTNPSNYVNAAGASAAAPIQTVTGDGVDNTNVGNVVISYPTIDDIGAYSNTNPANYINVAQAAAAAPVQSVNGQTNVVVLNADDVGAYSNTNPAGYVNATGAAAAAPIQTVTGDGVDNTNVGNVVISFPTLDQIGAYSNTNPDAFVNSTGAAAAAPVQSVNGNTGNVNVNVTSLTDTNITNAVDGQVLTYQSGLWINADAVGNPLVATPVNVSPADEATDIGETPTLTGSTYLSLYGVAMAAGQWQVSTVSNFASTVVDTGDVAGTSVSYTVSAGVLSVSTTYYWRVRYKDDNGTYSAYSTPTEFTTAAAFTTPFIAVAHVTSPYVTAYPFDASTGFGTKFSDPATLPTGAGTGVAFTSSGDAIAIAHETSPYITAYPWSSSGFGTKYSDPATLPANNGKDVAFTIAEDAIAIVHNLSPYVTAYPWSGSGFGTKFSNPATLPTSTGNGIAFSPAGDAIVVSHQTSPYVTAYPWSGSGFGTKFSNPATLPSGTGFDVEFSPNGNDVAISHVASPYVTVYPWSGSGFGTKYSNPATLPTGNAQGVGFSPNSDAIAIVHSISPYVTVYPWSGSGFGTKYSDPATLPTGTCYGVKFLPAGDAIAVAHVTSPYVTAYPWSGSGFGTKYSNPATLPAGTGNDVAFTLA